MLLQLNSLTYNQKNALMKFKYSKYTCTLTKAINHKLQTEYQYRWEEMIKPNSKLAEVHLTLSSETLSFPSWQIASS